MPNFIVSFFRCLPVSRRVLEAYLVALILIVAAFPDVIFNQASLRLTDQITGAFNGVPLKPFYPIPNSTGWWAGYNDNGGATYQSEPMIQFMANSIKNGESPYWNPYSAAGALGPEALVDQKFSFLTLLNAVMGGSSIVYNLVILGFAYFAVFFVYRIVRERFGLTALAATSACIFYLLNGYITANFGSNVTQSYFLVPLCLYAALSFVQFTSVLRWISVVLSFALFFSFTFMPTTITSIIAMGVVVIGFIVQAMRERDWSIKHVTLLLSLLAGGLLASLLLLAPLYFPFVESLSSLGTLDDYSKRVFWSLNFPYALASFYSPSHLIESYNAMEPAAILWDTGASSSSIMGNTVYHSGVIAIALAGCALFRKTDHFKWLVRLSFIGITLVVVRLFDPLWINFIFKYLPVVGNIGSQYWWPVIMTLMTFMVGFGVAAIQAQRFRLFPAFILMLICCASVAVMFKVYGLREPHIDYKTNSLIFLVGLLIFIMFSLLLIRVFNNSRFSNLLIGSALIVMFTELLVGGKMIRFERNDLFTNIPVALKYVKDNAGLYRSLNFGQGGLYPELGSAFGIQELTTINQGLLPAFKDYFYASINLESRQRLGFHPTLAPEGAFPSLILIQDTPSSNKIDWAAVSLLGVKYLILPTTYTSYRAELRSLGFSEVFASDASVIVENKGVLPRAFSIDKPVGDAGAFSLARGFESTLAPASIDSYRNGMVLISGAVSRESLVVLTDNWHKNWSATLNGKKVPILKINGTLRGIVVPAGDYQIRMDYQPASLSVAIGSSLFIILFLIVIGFKRRGLDTAVRARLVS
ncbi:hypothetical protein [Pseudomonas sp. C9]|uniref:hypothetical protein n=1 Tax=Pseudomonas sp. C9 TaxID=1311337 RepID=UPI0011155B43|nr:hypothetical protein [Pseudomonas sp. C9]